MLSWVSWYHPNSFVSLQYANESLKLAVEIEDLQLQAEAWEIIGHAQRNLGNSSLSFEAAFESLQIYESLGLLEYQAASYNQIANNYILEKDHEMAITYFKKAKPIFLDFELMYKYFSTVLNLGESYRLNGQLELAEASFLEVLESTVIEENQILKGYALGNLGMVYCSQHKFLEANKNLKEAIGILRAVNDWYSTSVYIAELGEVQRKKGAISAAETYYLEAYAMAKKNGLKEQVRDFSKMLTNLYEKNEKYAKALSFQKTYQTYQDSLVNKTNIKQIEQLKSGYEINKRESEINVLHIKNTSQKRWVIGLSIGVFVFLVLAYLLFIGIKKIRKANVILSEQKEIISKKEQEKAWLLRELNHRVKNNLQMISSLLNLQSSKLDGHPAQEAIITGKNRVEALSLVHRKLYQEGVDTRIYVKEYVEELVLGLFHGYNAHFEPEFDIDDSSVSIDIAIPLALIINELVINSLKYAYKDIEKPKFKISMKPNGANRLGIEIVDNGIGFGDLTQKKSNSLGLKLIDSLIMQLEGKVEKLEGKGTHWKMEIKSK
ncbi:sensor histidine kinase [Flavicella sediminum]|uniref:sensor histidine kinase n=1 Tax=Flavicella sediminum TaxID=2585141 RepID=UPI00111FB004|nr:sensor histidine kinase [Flavicella sediminum]